jgi:hypothetical protein
MAYDLAGRMVESCTCDVICPCWVGQDPDGGTCGSTIAWRVDKGVIDGIDVSGLTVAVAVQIPGNALKGNWRVLMFIDEQASIEQEAALVEVFSGQKGGPVADLAGLVGEVVAVKRAPIAFEFDQGQGRLQIGSVIAADVEGVKGASGAPTVLSDAAFSVIAGAPYYVGKARSLRQMIPELGQTIDMEGRSTVQGPFRFQA